MNFFNIFEHLLPKARAWQLTIQKTLKDFFEGLSTLPQDIRNFFDLIWDDIDPFKTRQLEEWENQFGIVNTGLTEIQRRDRLDSRWKEFGGQSPKYIQDTLQSYGFNVYAHEWWVPGSEAAVGIKACATARNPFTYLSDGGTIYTIQCGELLAECGEPLAQCGQLSGAGGHVLVNKVYISSLLGFECGEDLAECGEPLAQCGETFGFAQRLKQYSIPIDSLKWPYFLYIGGQTFGDFATVDPKRKDEFERLCLKICPAQQWLGIMVQYI